MSTSTTGTTVVDGGSPGTTGAAVQPPRDRAARLVLRGRREEPLSRWLWLVKWLLLVPHYVVLAALAVAFAVVTVVAFVAVLITGRYPASLFAFNRGVLRWGWRVGFYGYSALGTDRYPPFSLGEVPDYPATLDLDPPERLSRGLVLVKWWLLALPHYLVLGVLASGATWTVQRTTEGTATSTSTGLLELLVLFAGVALLFTGRYPRGLFDLVVGIDRWVLRVVAYAALMTDAYPPFRLDQGGQPPEDRDDDDGDRAPRAPAAAPSDPAGSSAGSPSAAGPASPATAAPAAGGAGSVVALVVGLLLLLPAAAGTGLGAGALTLESQRDADGYLTTPATRLSTPTAALVLGDAELELGPDAVQWLARRDLGAVRVSATGDGGAPVFVGIAPAADVSRWLDGTAHDVVTSAAGAGGATYERSPGAATAVPPARGVAWSASAAGTGAQQLRWPLQSGRWDLVVASPDGSPGVGAAVDLGVRAPRLVSSGVVLLASGLLLLAVAVALLVLGASGVGARLRTAADRRDDPLTGPPGPQDRGRPEPERRWAG